MFIYPHFFPSLVTKMRYDEDRITLEELAVAQDRERLIRYKETDNVVGHEPLLIVYDLTKDRKGYLTRIGLDE